VGGVGGSGAAPPDSEIVRLAFEITLWHRRRPEADQSARL